MKLLRQFHSRSLALAFALAGLLAALGPVQLLPQPAHAQIGGGWCFDDPVITINSQQSQYIVGIQGDQSAIAAAGVVANIVVYVPEGVSTSVVVPPSMTPFPETLRFATRGTYNGHGAVHVEVQVTFTSTGSGVFQTVLQAYHHNGHTKIVDGTTQSTLRADYSD